MTDTCTHLDTIQDVQPSSPGCQDCLRIGSQWVHLRLCMRCGHVGCCDNSPNRYATAHWRSHSDHPDAPPAHARTHPADSVEAPVL